MDSSASRQRLPNLMRDAEEIASLLRQVLAALEEQQSKDRLLADLHARYIALQDGALRAAILKPLWEDLLLLYDRIVRQQQALADFSARRQRAQDVREPYRSLMKFCDSTILELAETLRRSGLDRIEPGETFDPRTMHVVNRQSAAAPRTPGRWVVVKKVRDGFQHQGRVLRRADVIVAWRPERHGNDSTPHRTPSERSDS